MRSSLVMTADDPAESVPVGESPLPTLPEPPTPAEQQRYRAVWRQLVLARAADLRAELSALPEPDPGCVSRVVDLLTTAEDVAARHPAGLRTWWQGTLSERSWRALHTAEALMVRLESDAQVRARVPCIVAYAERYLAPADRTLCAVRHTLLGADTDGDGRPDRQEPLTEPQRRLLENLLRAAHAAADADYAAGRSFRNRLVRVTASLLVLLGLIVVVAALSSPFLRGIPGPPWKDVLVVAVFGAAGAVITAVKPLAEAGGTYNPFSLPSWQGTVKILVGVLSAILGVVAISAGVVPGVTVTNSADAIFWAVAFGASQQALTSTVDLRVKQLTGSTGSLASGASVPCDRPSTDAGARTSA